VQNRQGYLNLCELLARGLDGERPARPGLGHWDWLAELQRGADRAVGRRPGRRGQALLAGDGRAAEAVAQRWRRPFPGRFYIELQRSRPATNEAHVRAAVPLAAELGLPVVATHPIQFLEPDDFEAHEARTCVAEGETLANPKRIKRFTREQYFKTQAQMEALFADLPSALANTRGDRAPLQPDAGAGQAAAARLPDAHARPTARRMPMGDYFRQAARGPGAAPAAPVPRRRARCASARAMWSGWTSRSTPS
jgi:DNA polymerase-3 subunit alpha